MKKTIILLTNSFFILTVGCTGGIEQDDISLNLNEGTVEMSLEHGFVPEEAYPESEKNLLELPGGLILEEYNGEFIMGGDMILTEEQVQMLSGPSPFGAFTPEIAKLWPKGKIYFDIDDSLFAYIEDIFWAIEHIEANTNLRFWLRNDYRSGHIKMVRDIDKGNAATLGYTGREQSLTLGSFNRGIIAHEFLHAVGMQHEHQRPDRDNYIKVLMQNISPDKQFAFSLISNVHTYGQFDFGSIMMYGSEAFSKNKLPTITRLDGTTFIGQRDAMSSLDRYAVNQKYPTAFNKDYDYFFYKDNYVNQEGRILRTSSYVIEEKKASPTARNYQYTLRCVDGGSGQHNPSPYYVGGNVTISRITTARTFEFESFNHTSDRYGNFFETTCELYSVTKL